MLIKIVQLPTSTNLLIISATEEPPVSLPHGVASGLFILLGEINAKEKIGSMVGEGAKGLFFFITGHIVEAQESLSIGLVLLHYVSYR